MPRVVHFELTSDDPEKSATFFQDVFDWKITKWDGPQEYWLVETGEEGEPGINGGLFRPSGIFSGTVNTIAVPDIDAYIEKVKQHGGEIVIEKNAIPGVGYSANAKDEGGTLFGIHQEDPTAK